MTASERVKVLRAEIAQRDAEIERLRARVEVLEGLAHQSLTVLQCSDDHSEHWCVHCDDNIGGSHIVALRAALEAKP
jgi:hypothetical protein